MPFETFSRHLGDGHGGAPEGLRKRIHRAKKQRILSPFVILTMLSSSMTRSGAPAQVARLATLAEFRMVETILKDETNPTNRTLADALAQAGFLKNGKPNVAAVRVPMESEYRDFWELPYEPIVKTKLAFWLAARSNELVTT